MKEIEGVEKVLKWVGVDEEKGVSKKQEKGKC